MHLLYTRFKTVAGKMAPLLGELERRAKKYPDELGSLLSECHSAYFSVRKALLVPRVLEEIKGLDPSRSELVELVRGFATFVVYQVVHAGFCLDSIGMQLPQAALYG